MGGKEEGNFAGKKSRNIELLPIFSAGRKGREKSMRAPWRKMKRSSFFLLECFVWVPLSESYSDFSSFVPSSSSFSFSSLLVLWRSKFRTPAHETSKDSTKKTQGPFFCVSLRKIVGEKYCGGTSLRRWGRKTLIFLGRVILSEARDHTWRVVGLSVEPKNCSRTH